MAARLAVSGVLVEPSPTTEDSILSWEMRDRGSVSPEHVRPGDCISAPDQARLAKCMHRRSQETNRLSHLRSPVSPKRAAALGRAPFFLEQSFCLALLFALRAYLYCSSNAGPHVKVPSWDSRERQQHPAESPQIGPLELHCANKTSAGKPLSAETGQSHTDVIIDFRLRFR